MEKIESFHFESKEKEKFKNLTIFTTTFYKDDEASKVRASVAEKLFENIDKLNIECIVVDGGSSEWFIDKIKAFKNVKMVIEPSLKMGESRREALRIAMEKNRDDNNALFLWVEPEKEDLIKEESLLAMIEPLKSGSADVVVPSRMSKDSYPKFQKWIEERANKRAGQLFNESENDKLFDAEVDLWFGPKMFNKEGAQSFLDYKGDLDKWDSIIKPVIEAQKAGKNIASVPVDFEYPKEQKKYEEGNRVFDQKRIDQYKQILAELGDPHWVNKEK